MENNKSREIIIGLIAFTLGLFIMFLFFPKRIAKLENGEEVVAETSKGNITANDIYNDLKEDYAASSVIKLTDTLILNSLYTLTEEDEEEITKTANSYYSSYENYYGITKEEFLSQNGFTSEEEFLSYLRLDYLRNMYYNDYLESKITDEDIENYYNSSVFAPFSVDHIVVQITDELTDSEAKTIATNILNDLKNGKSWDEVKEIYNDSIKAESLTVYFYSNLDDNFKEAALKLKDGETTKSLVKSSYGYHIITKNETLDKPTLEESAYYITATLKSELTSEYKYASVINEMRNEFNLKILDTEIKSKYNEYLKSLEY